MSGSMNLQSLFQNPAGGGTTNDAKRLGLDDETSGILAGNITAATAPMCLGQPFTDDEEDTDDFRVILFGFDDSGSMNGVRSDLVECFNDIVVPGLLGGAADQVGAIRVGGIKFGRRVTPLWGGGFQPLTTLPRLTDADYRAMDGNTALNQGALDAVTAASSFALQLKQRTKAFPEVVIVILSDGANNVAPYDAEDVRSVLSKLSIELFTTVFIGFETGESVDFNAIAREMGFREVMQSKRLPGEDEDAQKRRFRNVMKVFSQKLSNRVSQKMAGSNNAQPGNFWS